MHTHSRSTKPHLQAEWPRVAFPPLAPVIFFSFLAPSGDFWLSPFFFSNFCSAAIHFLLVNFLQVPAPFPLLGLHNVAQVST